MPELPPQGSEEARLELPPPMSPGTLRGLGSHVWQATFDQKGDGGGHYPSRSMSARLVWSELDVYEFEEYIDGELRLQERRLDRDKWRRTSAQAPWIRTLGTSGDSLVLGRTTLPWTQAMQPFEELATWERLPDDVIDSRPVHVYRVRLGAAPAPDSALPLTPDQAQARQSRRATPVELEGRVFVDAETGNRLLAELEGRFVPFSNAGGHDLEDEVSITYRESRAITPLPPDVVPPPVADVLDRTRSGRRRFQVGHAATPTAGGR